MTQSRLSVMLAASVGVSPPAGGAPQSKKLATRWGENVTLPCADRGLGGIMVRRLSCPRLLASTVLRGTPALREHRLVGQAFVMHEPPMARLPACEQLHADVDTAHAKRAGTVRRHAALDLATAVTAQGEARVLTSQ